MGLCRGRSCTENEASGAYGGDVHRKGRFFVHVLGTYTEKDDCLCMCLMGAMGSTAKGRRVVA